MPARGVSEIVASLANREAPRTEATIQAEVRELLLAAPLGLDPEHVVSLEAPVAERRRIDVEVGFTVIEVKKDLRKGKVRREAERQLAGYVQSRSSELGQRYVGVLTDGAEWHAYQVRDGELAAVSSTAVSAPRPDVDALLVWLEGVLATTQGVAPTPEEVKHRLGADSSAYALDRATLDALYADYAHLPSVRLKRELWSRLLTSALGTQFTDSDALFVEHTLLVNSAELIAHAVLGFDVATMPPASLLSGQQFEQAGITGVVEGNFFDWVLETPGGEAFIRTLARRLARFDWSAVDHDVLKVLYESVIGVETRKKLGEYYTPDWLAAHMVDATVTDPLNQRVLDPACGSGTFLFHTVRRYLTQADDAGVALGEALAGLTDQVMGLDLHPVAVTFARVTYLLAVGQQRLTDPSRGSVSVPVYLGDSLQWEQRVDLWSSGHLVVPTDGEQELLAAELRFPEPLVADAARFDQLVEVLADHAAKPRSAGQVPSLAGVFRLLAIDEAHQPAIRETFAVMCRLHDEGRDHIWSYYVRNVARPVWLAQPDNRVDVLIGNPPWLAYRHMPEALQGAFRNMSAARGLWHGATVATHQDLSGLFVARAIQLYLRGGGSFAFVMPNAALDREQFAGFRTGEYPAPGETAGVAFDTPWDLRRLRPHFFTRAASVVFGTRTTTQRARPMPTQAERWTGRIPPDYRFSTDVDEHITRAPGSLTVSDREAVGSPYKARFAQGANIVPRKLFVVEEQSAGPLGLPAGRRAVRSVWSAYHNPPWKDLDPIEGVVEAEFVRAVYLGENVLPFRLLPPLQAVIPLEHNQLLDGSSERLDLYPELAEWWRHAETLWREHRSSDRLELIDQLDYRRKLTQQLPIPRHRVVYGKAGMHLAAARVEDSRGLIDHKLYWAATASADEAHYLCAILNSPKTTELVRPLMSYGKDERDVDKYVWQLPIPLYDHTDERHRELAELGARAEQEINQLGIEEDRHFPALRRDIRQHLAASATGTKIEGLVTEMLS